ncbi:Rne/Rng family ribonuclease [Candidatus Calescamantes bacterium]|nr:Rne/Rng family ribonuclease [Candidatus Calescamantes bacterium]
MRLFLLTETTELVRCAILEERKIVEFHVERKTKKSLVGNIYKGKVKDVLPGMDAAFVDIGWDRTAYLFISEVIMPPVEGEEPEWEEEKGKPSIEKLLKEGEDILVQVVRDPIGSKGPRVTSFVSLPGRYLVLMPFSPHLGVSRRIENISERRRLRKILRDIKPENMGLIARTMAEGKDKQDLLGDLEYLLCVWRNISSRAHRLPSPSHLYEEIELGSRLLRDIFDPENDRFLTDSPALFRNLKRFSSQILANRRVRIDLFSHQEDLFTHYHVDEEMEKALSPQVKLESGGDLTIHETEALISIDVNTGKYTGKESLEETAFKTNMEAAKEVFRQIQLRNLAGIIVVDFIDMRKREHKKKLENLLYDLAKKDRARTQISRITEFGLVQMTRQKVAPSISYLLSDTCPFCKGSGKVKSLLTLASEVESKVKRIMREKKGKVSVKVALNPELYNYIMERKLIKTSGRIFLRRIILEKKNLPWGEYKIICEGRNGCII